MKTNKTELQNALNIVKAGLANKEIIEQMTSFAFIDGNVVTYNDEISVKHPLPGITITGAVKAEELYAIVSKFKADEIDVEITETEILLSCGKASAGLTLQSEILLPLDELKGKRKWQALPKNFGDMLAMASQSASSDMSRPVLTAVYLTADLLVSTDSYRISHVIPAQPLPFTNILIPAASVDKVLKINPTKVSVSQAWIHWMNEVGTELSCRTMEDKYPNTLPFMSPKEAGTPVLFPAVLPDMIDRADVFAKRQHALDACIEIGLNDKTLTISAKSDTGWFKEDCRCRFTGAPMTFQITPMLIKAILSKEQTSELYQGSIIFCGSGEGFDWKYLTLTKEYKG